MASVQPLIGRDGELRFLGEHLAAARRRSSSAVVLVGEAGIGKSALLEHCQAAAPDFTVLATRGLAAEEHLSFATLYDLFNPIKHAIGQLPRRQADVLESAIGIGPPVEAGRFEVAAAVLTALANAAEEQPLLVVVDDAQWADESSLDRLAFAARRLHAESVLVLFALRLGKPGPG